MTSGDYSKSQQLISIAQAIDIPVPTMADPFDSALCVRLFIDGRVRELTVSQGPSPPS
jgi:hypothetical protein